MARILVAAAVLLVVLLVWRLPGSPDRAPAGSGSDSSTSYWGDDADDEGPRRSSRPLSGASSRFWMTADRASFEDLQRKADLGDAVAQRELAWAYDRCYHVSLLAPEVRPRTVDFANAMPSVEEARVARAAAESVLDECAEVDDGQVIPREAITLWMRQAALGGDLEALVVDRMYSHDPSFGDAAMWDRTIAERNVGALYALANATGSAAFEQRFGHVVEENGAYLVVALSACRMGYDCSPGSRMMRSFCVLTMQCGAGSFEELILQKVPPAEGRKLQAQVDGFIRELGSGPNGWR